MSEIRKVNNVRLVNDRGVEWTTFKYEHGVSSFHAAQQHLEVDCDFVIAIDIERLVKTLGHKAAFSKGQKSQLASGIIQVRCLGKRVIKDERKPRSIPAGYVKVEKAAA